MKSSGNPVSAFRPLAMSPAESVGPRKRRAERIANDNGLPAQKGHRQIERFGKVESGNVRRKQNLRTDRRVKERFVDVRRNACDAVAYQIARERLKASAEYRAAARAAWLPVGRRLRERPAIGADEHAADRARAELEAEAAKLIARVVGTP